MARALAVSRIEMYRMQADRVCVRRNIQIAQI